MKINSFIYRVTIINVYEKNVKYLKPTECTNLFQHVNVATSIRSYDTLDIAVIFDNDMVQTNSKILHDPLKCRNIDAVDNWMAISCLVTVSSYFLHIYF